MFGKKFFRLAFFGLTLTLGSVSVNADSRVIMFNGIMASEYEYPILDIALGYTAPSGYYFHNPANGALFYSTGSTPLVLLGFTPTNLASQPQSYMDMDYESVKADFCGRMGGCELD
ncbi:hypothetical protein [Thiothrix nivea]|uniref:Uncharacterized protein n=1 Tax=Thiothrix nivea (strain ATCC 35100 / DSM 5205 / JP2) TaxID=870187 RepID=A0A656HDK7_THINJ|nr:hypothetical protein [Thiothrix nivea]EIJ34064.1 hypothetical protein Thini_1461 [Thiothrix nivea DSM 5205]